MTLSKKSNETDEEFKLRVFLEKRKNPSITWDDVAIVVNHELHQNSSPNKYRKEFNKKFRSYILEDCGIVDVAISSSDEETIIQNITEQLNMLRKEKTIVADMRRDANAQLRAFDRLSDIREIAKESAAEIAKNLNYYKFDTYVTKKEKNSYKEGVLVLNDWHFGIEIDEYLNKRLLK